MRGRQLWRWLKYGLVALIVAFCVLQIAGRIVYRERLPTDRSAFSGADVIQSAHHDAAPRHLVVLFHGYTGKPMTDVKVAVNEVYPDADVLAPSYSSSVLTNEDPLNIAREYMMAIDQATSRVTYERITLVGYSLGALIARKVVVCAYTGCNADYDTTERPRDWRTRLDRIVLMAGMNRGWATHCEKVVAVEKAKGVGYDNDCRAKYLKWHQWLGAELGERLAPIFGVGKLITSVQSGAPFVANLRLEWLELQDKQSLPPVVQLLSDIDEIVSRSDNLDEFVTSRFVFIPLQQTTHANVIEMTGPEGSARKARFVEALTWPIDRLQGTYPPLPNPDYTRDPAVKRVVMIIHGIRDDGRWTAPLGEQFHQADSSTRAFSRSYGYFSALYFLTPARMDANVRWFVDQYTQLRALYPAADFDFVGHSNGTYMLAEALARYHAVRFHRVVLAGTVVQTGFDWSRIASQKRVSAVRNYRASNDLVVAALPSVFEHVHGFLKDVGGAGHAGFIDDFARRTESRFFVKGGHGAVFGNAGTYPTLVNYVLERSTCTDEGNCAAYELPPELRTDEQSIYSVIAYKFTVFVWLAAVLLVGSVAYALSHVILPGRKHRSRTGRLVRSAIAGVLVFGVVIAILRYV